MSSPFSVFRKYQAALLVGFGVVLMVAFVIAPPILDWQHGRSRGVGETENAVVVSWNGGSLREKDVQSLELLRNLARLFIDALIEKTIAQNGNPRVPRLLVFRSEEDAVRTFILAQQAERAGLSVSDEAIKEYLSQMCAELLKLPEIGAVFQQTLGGRMSEPQLFGVLRTELLAQNYLTMTHPHIFLGAGGSALPYAAWKYHQRLHRRVKAEVIPLEVAEFKSELKVLPSDEQVAALYEQGKNRFPDPDRPEPGFKRPLKASFEYVQADLEKLVEQELEAAQKSVTDKEVEEHYEKNIDLYPALDVPSPTSDAKEATTAVPGKQPAEAGKPASTAEKEPADAGAKKQGEGLAPAPQASGKGDAVKPAAGPETYKAPQASEAEKAKNVEPAPKAGRPPGAGSDVRPSDKPSSPQGKGAARARPAPLQTYLVSLEAAGSAAGDMGMVEAGKAEKPASPAGSSPVKLSAEPSLPADQATPTPPAAAKPSGKPTLQQPSPPAKDAQRGAPEKEKEPPPAAQEPAKQMKYRPLDDKLRSQIREQIARSRARAAAHDRIAKAFAEVRQEVERYAKTLKRSTGATPEKFDLEEVARRLSLTPGKTPLTDALGVQAYDIGKASEIVDFSWPPQRQYFYQIAYQEDLPLYRPAEIRGATSNVRFLYWKVKEEKPYVPALADIRHEVVEAWKQREALTLANREASRLRDLASKSGKSLKETFAGQSGLVVKETNDFSWLSTGFTPLGSSMPRLSHVENVVGAGDGFMRTVFNLKLGEVGTAVNEPETFVYVIRIVSEAPSEEDLRQQFLQSGNSTDVRNIAAIESQRVLGDWLRNLEMSLNVTWHRPPRG